jgi:peroxiredoxin Q/BCP
MTAAIAVGRTAPDFSLASDGGGKFKLSARRGAPVVLYFYPKDDTSGCTREALDFTASLAEFKKLGATVIGTSPDSVAKHDKFKSKHNLGVVLAADEDKTVCERYGVWIEKSMYGRKYMGVDRSTFLIDASGKVARIWRKVKVPGHVDEVLAAIKAM